MGCFLCRKGFEQSHTEGGEVNLFPHSRFSCTAAGVNLSNKLSPSTSVLCSSQAHCICYVETRTRFLCCLFFSEYLRCEI